MTTKSNDVHLYMINILRGGVVNKRETALKIAEILLDDLYGQDKVLAYRPFEVEDLGDAWKITGRGSKNESSPLVMISKMDGRILDIMISVKMALPKEIPQPFLNNKSD